MKTILRITLILLVAAVAAGAFSLAVNNSSSATGTNQGANPPAMTSANGQTFQPVERPEGSDRDGASLAGGVGGILGTLAELTGISMLVLLLQKGLGQLSNLKLKFAQR